MKIAVGVATSGRKAILTCMIDRLAAQTRRPDHLLLSPCTDEDIDMERLRSAPFPVSIIRSQKGSCPQHDAIINAAADTRKSPIGGLDQSFCSIPYGRRAKVNALRIQLSRGRQHD